MVQRLTLKVFVSHRVLWRFCVIIMEKWQQPTHRAFSEFHVTDRCCSSQVHRIWVSHLRSRLQLQQSALLEDIKEEKYFSFSQVWFWFFLGNTSEPILRNTIQKLRGGSRAAVQTTLSKTRPKKTPSKTMNVHSKVNCKSIFLTVQKVLGISFNFPLRHDHITCVALKIINIHKITGSISFKNQSIKLSRCLCLLVALDCRYLRSPFVHCWSIFLLYVIMTIDWHSAVCGGFLPCNSLEGGRAVQRQHRQTPCGQHGCQSQLFIFNMKVPQVFSMQKH